MCLTREVGYLVKLGSLILVGRRAPLAIWSCASHVRHGFIGRWSAWPASIGVGNRLGIGQHGNHRVEVEMPAMRRGLSRSAAA